MGALLASLCCVVPVILLGLGAGTAVAGTFAALKPYRPFFVAAALAALAAAWWRSYRRCGGSCPASPRDHLVLWAGTGLVLCLLWLPAALRSPDGGGEFPRAAAQADGNQPTSLPPPPAAVTRTVTLRISGMTCAACPLVVQQALEGVPGVAWAKVTLAPPVATVTAADPAALDPQALVVAVEQAGYGAEVLATGLPPGTGVEGVPR